ncbi:hypothetical protein TNCT_540941, partial [Trichonephila clavata]
MRGNVFCRQAASVCQHRQGSFEIMMIS